MQLNSLWGDLFLAATWVQELQLLSSIIAVTQPHAAYSAFTHGVTSKIIACTIPNVDDLFSHLKNALDTPLFLQ